MARHNTENNTEVRPRDIEAKLLMRRRAFLLREMELHIDAVINSLSDISKYML